MPIRPGGRIIHGVRPVEFSDIRDSNRIRINWEGAHIRGRARRATWDGRISVKNARIVTAKTVAFDSPADGIIDSSPREVKFKSSTTGDVDGIDLFIENNNTGDITFESLLGTCRANLADLNQGVRTFDFGGLGLKVSIQRYPEALQETELAMEYALLPEPGKTVPYLIKAVQEDGHMAWSSPIYLRGKSR